MKKIELIITTTSSLHVASFSEDWRMKDGNRQLVRDTGNVKGKPITRTQRRPIMLSKSTQENLDLPGVVELPIFPSNDMRGRLHRESAKILFNHILEQDQTMNDHTFNGLSCGAFSGKPDNTLITLSEIEAVSNHMHMGVYGGGPRLHKSKLVTSDWLPIVDVSLSTGAVPSTIAGINAEDYVKTRANGAPVKYMSDICHIVDLVRKDDVESMSSVHYAEKVIENYREVLNAHQDAVQENQSKRKKAKEENGDAVKKDTIVSMSGFECVNIGASFYSYLGLPDMTDAQIGFVLESLAKLFTKGRFGGNTRYKTGSVSVQAFLTENGEKISDALEFDTASESYFVSEGCAEYTDAMCEEMESIDSDDLTRFFVNGVHAA